MGWLLIEHKSTKFYGNRLGIDPTPASPLEGAGSGCAVICKGTRITDPTPAGSGCAVICEGTRITDPTSAGSGCAVICGKGITDPNSAGSGCAVICGRITDPTPAPPLEGRGVAAPLSLRVFAFSLYMRVQFIHARSVYTCAFSLYMRVQFIHARSVYTCDSCITYFMYHLSLVSTIGTMTSSSVASPKDIFRKTCMTLRAVSRSARENSMRVTPPCCRFTFRTC